MKEPIVGFRDPFADEVMWHMTVIANSHRVVTAVLPGIHGVVHDMAVDAGFRIVAKVAGTFGIDKGIDSQADEDTGCD